MPERQAYTFASQSDFYQYKSACDANTILAISVKA